MTEVFIVILIALVYLNLVPFIHSDVYGRYFRTKEVYYVHSEKNRYGDTVIRCNLLDSQIVEEKCNPWLMWWHLIKIKPRIIGWKFDSDETRKLWDEVKNY